MNLSSIGSARRPRGGAGEINVENVAFSIQDRLRRDVRLVDRCSFLAERGLFTVLVGPSGCGKTTLLNMIAGYFRPHEGQIRIDGVPVTGPGWDRLTVFQESALFPWMTAIDNVAYGPLVRRIDPLPAIRKRAADLLDKFGLGDFKQRYPRELSGGMQRRCELARVLINDPLVLLMDEPFRGLDAMTRQLMQQYLSNLFEEARTTTIFVTSEIDEAIFLADRLIVLSRAPTKAALVMNVDLPRPRNVGMLTSATYASLKVRALDVLYREAVAGLGSGIAQSELQQALDRTRVA